MIESCELLLKGESLPPVQIVLTPSGSAPFELLDGVHRLYLSLALGYTHVPAVPVLKLDTIIEGIRAEHPEDEK